MTNALLLVAIGLLLVSLGFQMVAHRRWSQWAEERQRDSTRMWAAHHRVVEHVYSPDAKHARPVLPPPPTCAFPLERRADWSDDRLKTRRLDGKETFLPVDFQHDLW